MSWNTAKKRFQADLEKMSNRARGKYMNDLKKMQLPTFETALRPIPQNERRTDLKDIGFAPGDFAYITEGPHKGTISTVLQYTSEFDQVYLSSVTSKKIIPKENWVPNQSSHLMDYPEPISAKDIKVAAKDKDEKGNVYYVVADDIVQKDKYYDSRYYRWLPKRFIKHHDAIEIPWPNPPQEQKPGALSTSPEVAKEKTWELQSIVKSPFPSKVLKELRNPYSQYKKKALSDIQARKLNAPEMPLSKEQKIYLAKKDAEPKKQLQRLSPEIQDFIGEKIANHVNKIDNPYLLAHLDALSNVKIPDFAKTMSKIEESEKRQQNQS